ncbi:MAG: hypothetical protein U9P71_06805, partial [Campylobacterota bacterium]|nr:hypothetical protein [Campylobacterota bacterium]
SQIKGEFSSKTYLKYYLDSLDREKASDDQRELFKLYRYLEELEQHTTVVMLSEIDEMLELKRIFSSSDMKINIKTFVEDKNAMAWASSHYVTLFILDDSSHNKSVMQFIAKYINSTNGELKVIWITNKETIVLEDNSIQSIIKVPYTAKEIIETVKNLLGESNG